MRVLTVDNVSFTMDQVPDKIDDLRFCILDITDPKTSDFIFIPLIFLESYSYPIAELKIGNNTIHVPLNWYIVVGDQQHRELEIIPITDINGREFYSFCLNPITSFVPSFLKIEITNIFPDVKWDLPKLKQGHILCVPLEMKKNPICAYLVKEVNKSFEVIDIGNIL